MPTLDSVLAHARLLSRRRPGLRAGATIPYLERSVKSLRIEPEALRRYCTLTGFASGEPLPLTAPQVFAAGLHVDLLGDRRFALPALGLVHLRNRIEQREPLPSGESYEVRCFVEGHRDVPLGVEFDLHTEFKREGRLVWSSVTSVLSRKRGAVSEKRAAEEPAATGSATLLRELECAVPAAQGRLYAAVAGDLNPIHQYGWSARLLGFPRAIVHGMWTLARVVALADGLLPKGPLSVEARFRKPLLLPGRVRFVVREGVDALVLAAEQPAGGTPYLQACARPLALSAATDGP